MVTDSDPDNTHEWLRLAADEELLWQSQPRIVKTIPSILFGLLVAGGGVVGASIENVLFAVLVPLGALIAIWGVLRNRRSWYIVTTRALYLKTGVLGRSVRSVEYDRVQNSQYRQSVTGTLFGHGAVAIDIDGGSDLTFRAIYDPDEVQEAIRRQIGIDTAGSGSSSDEIPGTREEWLDVLEELRAIRAALEAGR